MSNKRTIAGIMRENKTFFIVIAVILILLEVEIFSLAVMKSGRKSWLEVMDANGNVIHETDGDNLSDFNKYYFEKTFGPFENYQVRLVKKEVPFPFRAWFVAAVGIPVGAILLFGFAVRAFMSLFYGEDQKTAQPGLEKNEYENRFEKIIAMVSRFNIFIIGFIVLSSVFAYWVVPNLIVYLGHISIETLKRYKWIFLSASIIFLGVIIWVIYLRYLLAQKSIESRTEINKYRMQLEFKQNDSVPLQLEYEEKNETENPKD